MIIDDFPVEILIQFIDDGISDLNLPTNRVRELMGVCRLWYNVITSVPKFWTSVCVIIESTPTEIFQCHLWRLAAQLSRCKLALIDVRWQVRMFENQTVQLMEFFGEHAPFERWRSLSIVSHEGYLPNITRTLSPLGVFRSLETLTVGHCPRHWILDYIDRTLPPRGPLKEFKYPRLGLLLQINPHLLRNILHKVTRLHTDSLPWQTGDHLHGLPTNITDLSVDTFHFSHLTILPHVERLVVRSTASVDDLALHSFARLTRLDVAFEYTRPIHRLPFPNLLHFCVRGKHCTVLPFIDAPKLENLTVEILVPERQRNPQKGRGRGMVSLEWAVGCPTYALRPTEELQVRMVVSAQTLQLLLDRSPRLKNLVVYMEGGSDDREVLRRLLFPSAPAEETDTARSLQEADPSTLPSEHHSTAGKSRGRALVSLSVYLEREWMVADAMMWEACMLRFKDVAGKVGTVDQDLRFECFWTQ